MSIFDLLEKYSHTLDKDVQGYGPVSHEEMRFLLNAVLFYRDLTWVFGITIIIFLAMRWL